MVYLGYNVLHSNIYRLIMLNIFHYTFNILNYSLWKDEKIDVLNHWIYSIYINTLIFYGNFNRITI